VRLDAVGESWIERGIAHTNLAPWPILHTQFAYTLARVVMAATRLGVFDALDDEPLAGAEVARRCSTDPAATENSCLPSRAPVTFGRSSRDTR
jgi:hypothetical protein